MARKNPRHERGLIMLSTRTLKNTFRMDVWGSLYIAFVIFIFFSPLLFVICLSENEPDWFFPVSSACSVILFALVARFFTSIVITGEGITVKRYYGGVTPVPDQFGGWENIERVKMGWFYIHVYLKEKRKSPWQKIFLRDIFYNYHLVFPRYVERKESFIDLIKRFSPEDNPLRKFMIDNMDKL
jgi:hypothetical protein